MKKLTFEKRVSGVFFSLFIALILIPGVLGANDPGHDSLYVLKIGDSNVVGSINITGNLNASFVKVSNRLFGDYLDIVANGTILGAPSQPRIMGASSSLYIDSTGNLYINTLGGTTSTVQIGDVATNGVIFNVSGQIRQQNVLVCLSNGSNCISGNNSGNVSTVTAGDGLADSGTPSDPVFDVGAGDGISVGADDVSVDSTVCRSDGSNCPAGSAGSGWVNTSTVVRLASNNTNVSIGNTTGNLPVIFVDTASGYVGFRDSSPAQRIDVSGSIVASTSTSTPDGGAFKVNNTVHGTNFYTSEGLAGNAGGAFFGGGGESSQAFAVPVLGAWGTVGLFGGAIHTGGGRTTTGIYAYASQASNVTAGTNNGRAIYALADPSNNGNLSDGSWYGIQARSDISGIGMLHDSPNAYGGHFTAVSGTGGDAYGIYTTASGGDTNYGIYSAAGTNYFAGSVGIGKAVPGNALEVVGTINGTNILIGTTELCREDGTNCPATVVSAGSGWINETGIVRLFSNSTNVSVGNMTGNNPVLFVDVTNGRVGIGNSTPGHTLTVYGDSVNLSILNTAETASGLKFGDAQGESVQYANILYDSSSGILGFYEAGTTATMVIDAQEIGIGTTDPDAMLHLESNTASVIKLSDTGGGEWNISPFYVNNDGHFAISRDSGSGNILLGPGGGNVGIGTTSAYSTLQVQGTVNATSTIYQNNVAVCLSDGTNCPAESGNGNVSAVTASTDNAIVRFDSTTGLLIQNSAITIDDAGNLAGVGNITTTTTHFFIGPSTASATAGGAIGIGSDADATASNTIAIGTGTKAGGTNSVAIGNDAISYAGIAIGPSTSVGTSGQTTSVAVGASINNSGGNSVSVGIGIINPHHDSIGIGAYVGIGDQEVVAIGRSANASFYGGVALGRGALARNYYGVSVGWISNVTGDSGVAIGSRAASAGANAIAIGFNTTADQAYSVALGRNANTYADNQFVVGSNSQNLNTQIFGTLNATSTIYQNSIAVCLSDGTNCPAETGTGNVVSNTVSTDNVIARYDSTTGLVIQNSTITLDDAGNLGSVGNITTTTTHFFIGPSTASATAGGAIAIGSDADATATSAVAIGAGAKANVSTNTAVGAGALATGTQATAYGSSATASATYSVAIGQSALANSTQNIAIGQGAGAHGSDSANGQIAIGASSLVTGHIGVAIGYGASASNTMSIATGYNAASSGQRTVAIGPESIASGDYAIAMGWSAYSRSTDTIAIGRSSRANVSQYAIAVGYDSQATGQDSVAVGRSTRANNTNNIGIGVSATASGSGSTAIGGSATSSSTNTIAIGVSASSSGLSNVAVGPSATASGGQLATAVGPNSVASGIGATAYGYSALATAQNAVALGLLSRAEGTPSLAVGYSSHANSAGNTIALGDSTNASGAGALAVGGTARALSDYGIAIGIQSYTIGTQGIAIGRQSNSSHTSSVALGWGARTTADNQLMIGNSTVNLNTYIHGTLNATSTIYQNNVAVCLSDGTNCPASSATGSGLVNTSGSGNISLVSNTVNVSLNTLFVDNTNGRVGIGTSSPSQELTVHNDVVIGASTSNTETLSDNDFSLGGNDLFVAGEAGVEGNIYSDGQIKSGYVSATSASGAIVIDNSGRLSLGVIAGLNSFISTAGGYTLNINASNVGIRDNSPDADLEVVDDFMVSSTEAGNGDLFIVLNTGLVGIGTASPVRKLDVVGDINASGSGNIYYTGNLTGYGADLAELVHGEQTLEGGDVVIIDEESDEAVVRSTRPYDTRVAGIISTEPSHLMSADEGNIPLALAGRVPVKVTNENGPIKRGDLLTTSSTPGHAMRCIERSECTGAILGKAMEPLNDDTGMITALVVLG